MTDLSSFLLLSCFTINILLNYFLSQNILNVTDLFCHKKLKLI